MRGFPALVLQLLDALMLLPAMVPDGTSELGVCLGNTVPQGPDLVIRQVFHEERDQLSAVQSQVTSLIGYTASCSRTGFTHNGSLNRSQLVHELTLSVLRPRIVGETEANPIGNRRVVIEQEDL